MDSKPTRPICLTSWLKILSLSLRGEKRSESINCDAKRSALLSPWPWTPPPDSESWPSSQLWQLVTSLFSDFFLTLVSWNMTEPRLLLPVTWTTRTDPKHEPKTFGSHSGALAWCSLTLWDYTRGLFCAFSPQPEIIHRTHLLSAFTLHTVGVYMQRHRVWAQFQNTAVGALWWLLCTARWIMCHMLEGLYKYLWYCSQNIKNSVKEQHKEDRNVNDAFSLSNLLRTWERNRSIRQHVRWTSI